MKIITCASYFGSGSSALTDLVSEYDTVKDLSDYEFRFLHDIDGVSDLEFHLVECHNRHNSGHAIKRFERLCEFNEGNFLSKRYSSFIDVNVFREINERYINSLIDFTYKGWWFYDLYDKGSNKYYLYQILNHLYWKTHFEPFKILKNEETYCSHPSREDFLQKTKNYTSAMMRALNMENKPFLEIDQIVPSSNTERVLRYFEDEVFVFVVDRDPRDLFLLEKYFLHERSVPTDVDLFCKWFRYTREAGTGIPKDDPHIIKIQFEDIIYRYDDIKKRVESVTGLSPTDHNHQFSKMNPKRSLVNTQIWKRHDDPQAIKRIEELLPEYIYDYDTVGSNPIVGVEPKTDKLF